jgi:UDP-glucosyltransferase BX8/BX9
VQPCFADQMVNARYVTHEWGVGLEVGEEIERGRVAMAVTKLMAGEDAAQMRGRAYHLKILAAAATSLSIDSLIHYISSL